MRNYKISESQYGLVREGLEQLYYMYKDEGNKKILNAITELEESFIKQDEKIDREHKNMLNQIYNCYYDCMDKKPTQEQIEKIADEIKKELEYDAQQWGWDDTEIGDRIWNWINDNIKHG